MAIQTPPNTFVRRMRRVYNPLGFSKGYNFVLWFLSIGYLFAFTLARLEYLSFYGIFCGNDGPSGSGAAPGECYWWLQNPYKIGMMIHLFCILPAGLLVCLQFVPAIRHKLILFHRLNGYLVILLSLISSAGILIVARRAFGGEFATQTWSGVMVILTTIGYLMAWINIKVLQIDQHRAWMMRTWAWFATIITLRLIMIISAQIISGWTTTRPCAQIASTLGRGGTLAFYPGCSAYFDGTDLQQKVVVTADFDGTNPMQISAALAIPFGTAGWLALVLHTIAIELYLRLTPAESDRLRRVSFERQLARGYKRPGYAGLVAERFGDAQPYFPSDLIVSEPEFKDVTDEESKEKLDDRSGGVVSPTSGF